LGRKGRMGKSMSTDADADEGLRPAGPVLAVRVPT
jgi:hypothetical protein